MTSDDLISAPAPLPMDLAIVSPGLPHGPDCLETESKGGSETAAILVAQALVRRGHSVVLFSPGHQGGLDKAGVQYHPIETAPLYLACTQVDALVISRDLQACTLPGNATVRVLWCHDLALKRQRGSLQSVLFKLDAVYAPSQFHCDQIRDVHSILSEPGRLVRTRNGLDLAAFASLPTTRDPRKLVYGSRPERGLDAALNLMDDCAKAGLPYRLVVSGYDNTPPALADYYAGLYARAQAMPNVTLRGPLKRADWYAELATAQALIYPGACGPFASFREIYALVIAEAQAAGTPVIAARKGAIPETLHPGAGLLVGDEETDCASPVHRAALLVAVRRLEDPELWTDLSATGRAHGATLGWDGVAAQWEADFRARIAKKVACAARVRRHLVRTGDREAAGAVPVKESE